MTELTKLKTLPFQVNQKIVDLSLKQDALKERHLKEKKQAHAELWAAVHSEYPELDNDGNYSLKCQFAEQGIVMLAAHEERGSVDKFLAHLVKNL